MRRPVLHLNHDLRVHALPKRVGSLHKTESGSDGIDLDAFDLTLMYRFSVQCIGHGRARP
jgi:hypothetical protein